MKKYSFNCFFSVMFSLGKDHISEICQGMHALFHLSLCCTKLVTVPLANSRRARVKFSVIYIQCIRIYNIYIKYIFIYINI